VVAAADERIELFDAEAAVEVDGLNRDAVTGQETPGLAAGGSSGLGVEDGFHGGQ
jgi:hypothetical protein